MVEVFFLLQSLRMKKELEKGKSILLLMNLKTIKGDL